MINQSHPCHITDLPDPPEGTDPQAAIERYGEEVLERWVELHFRRASPDLKGPAVDYLLETMSNDFPAFLGDSEKEFLDALADRDAEKLGQAIIDRAESVAALIPRSELEERCIYSSHEDDHESGIRRGGAG